MLRSVRVIVNRLIIERLLDSRHPKVNEIRKIRHLENERKTKLIQVKEAK